MLYSWYIQTFNFLVHQSFCYTSYCQSIQGSLTQWTGWCNFRSLLSPSVNSRYRLTQFKVLYRFHNRFLPLSPPCVVNVVLHSHACCGLGQDIFDCFPKQCDSPVHLDCNLAKIDCSDKTVSFSSLQRRAPRSGTIAAKALILFEWKSASHPRFKRSRNELLLVAKLERTWCDKGTKGIFFYLDTAKHPVLFCYSNSQRFVHTHQDKAGAGRVLHSPSSWENVDQPCLIGIMGKNQSWLV